jgi:hypothetical protein
MDIPAVSNGVISHLLYTLIFLTPVIGCCHAGVLLGKALYHSTSPDIIDGTYIVTGFFGLCISLAMGYFFCGQLTKWRSSAQ